MNGIRATIHQVSTGKREEENQWFSTSPGYAGAIRRLVLSLPREWVLANIKEAVDAVLEDDATENEYRRTLELYRELDEGLMLNLAQRALKHGDEDIQEAGRDFLDNSASST